MLFIYYLLFQIIKIYCFSLYRSEDNADIATHFIVYKDKVPVLVQICREVIISKIS